ncbi:VanZ family protein [Arthrobacter sp. M4]|uniref:VanZ family protein n=1 Tax=Arthrobacter sp. M4 TaxID=218160 RepID=UPI001CDB671E|nr:VanZ family protein [Arthrobacter sp. M4]
MSRLEFPIPTETFWRRLLFGYFAVLGIIGFWPTPVDKPAQGMLMRTLSFLHRHGIPDWVDYGFTEATGNVLLFVPVGFLATLAYRSRSWWENAALGLMASACIEIGQWLFLPQRYPSIEDLILNTSGTIAGIFLVYVQRRGIAAS